MGSEISVMNFMETSCLRLKLVLEDGQAKVFRFTLGKTDLTGNFALRIGRAGLVLANILNVIFVFDYLYGSNICETKAPEGVLRLIAFLSAILLLNHLFVLGVVFVAKKLRIKKVRELVKYYRADIEKDIVHNALSIILAKSGMDLSRYIDIEDK